MSVIKNLLSALKCDGDEEKMERSLKYDGYYIIRGDELTPPRIDLFILIHLEKIKYYRQLDILNSIKNPSYKLITITPIDPKKMYGDRVKISDFVSKYEQDRKRDIELVCKNIDSFNKDVTSHVLVDKHELLTEEEYLALGVNKFNLSKILITDPQVEVLFAKVGDVIRIHRTGPVPSIVYRTVIDITTDINIH